MSTQSLVQGLAVGSSLWTSGALSAVSLMTVPALLSAPHNIAAKQFKLIHFLSVLTSPSATLVATALHALAAYQVRTGSLLNQSSWTRWATTAALTASVLPFTFGLMEPISHQLLAIAGTGEAREGGTEVSVRTEGLLRKWNSLNAIRSLLVGGAGLVGLWTIKEGPTL